MADPHIKSPMDFFRLSDCYYLPNWFCDSGVGCSYSELVSDLSLTFILIAATCCASSLHIYLKSFRLLFNLQLGLDYFFILIIILRWLLAVRYLL